MSLRISFPATLEHYYLFGLKSGDKDRLILGTIASLFTKFNLF